MNIIINRMLAFILSFLLIFATTARANANTSVGGWSAVDVITAGATNTINATKTAGGKVLQSAVTVAPSAVKVGKHLIKGGGAAALAFAVPQLLGDGVEWVLDPANNRVKYKERGGAGFVVYEFTFQGNKYRGASAICNAYFSNFTANGDVLTDKKITPKDNGKVVTCSASSAYACSSGTCTSPVSYVFYGTPVPEGDIEWQTLPIEDVAAQVISNAEAGHAPSQEAVKATALEGFAAGEHDAALDASATESDTDTENPPDTTDPENPSEPAEPFDPAGIISAINALKAMLAGILSSITSLSDWFQSEPPPEPKPEDTQLDIPTPDLPTPDTDINFGGSCPAPIVFDGSIFGQSIKFTMLDTVMLCDFLSTYVKWPVYAASSLFALYIVGGRKDV